MEFDGQVIAAFGRHLQVRDAHGRVHAARPFGRKLQVICGDIVRCAPDPAHGEIHVTEVYSRRSCLYRTNQRGGAEPVCANLTLLLVALAPVPDPDLFLVDRYLSAAASTSLNALLVVNKCELGYPAQLAAELEVFKRLGYPTLECSVKGDIGLARLQAACVGACAALVGQSGVGKSSLAGRLVPHEEVVTGELASTQEGRHTTTAARLYDLPGGGQLIDSPGVRDFAPALTQLEPRSLGFVEIARLAEGCRFGDCRHAREPGCAVQAALAAGELHARRLESYHRLLRLTDTLRAARGPSQKPRERGRPR